MLPQRTGILLAIIIATAGCAGEPVAEANGSTAQPTTGPSSNNAPPADQPDQPTAATPPDAETPTEPDPVDPGPDAPKANLSIDASEYTLGETIELWLQIDASEPVTWTLDDGHGLFIEGADTNRSLAIAAQVAGPYTLTLNVTNETQTVLQTGVTAHVYAPPPQWAPQATALIHPGVNTAGCTTNYVYTEYNVRFFIAAAAHCYTDDSSTSAAGCTRDPADIGSMQTIRLTDGTRIEAPLAYHAWGTMLDMGYTQDSHPDACSGNDFALLEIPAEYLASTSPDHPTFGGNTGLQSALDLVRGDTIYGYGSSTLRFDQAHEKRGVFLNYQYDDWSARVYLVTPGIFGDSGSAIFTEDGRALGVASTIALAPITGSNAYSLIAPMVDFANEHAGFHLELVQGTTPFKTWP